MRTVLVMFVFILFYRRCEAKDDAPVSSDSAQWLIMTRDLSFEQICELLDSRSGEWPKLHSLFYGEKQGAEELGRAKEGVILAEHVLAKLDKSIEAEPLSADRLELLIIDCLRFANSIKKRGGYINDVLSTTAETVAWRLSWFYIHDFTNEVPKIDVLFRADKSQHIQARNWLLARAAEDPWLWNHTENVQRIDNSKGVLGVSNVINEGRKLPQGETDGRPRALLSNTDVGYVWFLAVDSEFNLHVSIPMTIDFLKHGGKLSPEPSNPAQAVRSVLGPDLSQYGHDLLRNGKTSGADIWGTYRLMTNRARVIKALHFWLR